MNLPYLAVVTGKGGLCCIIAVTSRKPDGMDGCWYTLHCPQTGEDKIGFSLGFDGKGAGSALCAMANGKAAAKRLLKREAKRLECKADSQI